MGYCTDKCLGGGYANMGNELHYGGYGGDINVYNRMELLIDRIVSMAYSILCLHKLPGSSNTLTVGICHGM